MWTLVQHKKYFELVLKVSFFLKMIADGKERKPPEQKGRNRSFRFGKHLFRTYFGSKAMNTLLEVKTLGIGNIRDSPLMMRCSVSLNPMFPSFCLTLLHSFTRLLLPHRMKGTFFRHSNYPSRIINNNLIQRRPRDWLRSGLSSRFL